MSLLTALRLTIAFTIVPPLLCAAGFVLAALFGCAGSFHLESCRVAGAYRVVAPLLVMGWISVLTVPVGFVATAILAVVRWWRRSTSRSLTSDARTTN
jgi:hypothetical protein